MEKAVVLFFIPALIIAVMMALAVKAPVRVINFDEPLTITVVKSHQPQGVEEITFDEPLVVSVPVREMTLAGVEVVVHKPLPERSLAGYFYENLP